MSTRPFRLWIDLNLVYGEFVDVEAPTIHDAVREVESRGALVQFATSMDGGAR